MAKGLRAGVLLAPFLAVALLLALRTLGADRALIGVIESGRAWLTHMFAWGFVGVALGIVILIALVCVSGLGDVKIGGKDARPAFSSFEAVAIGVCATTSLGFLYWAAAEPVRHFLAPPSSLRIPPASEQAAIFARAAGYLHWSITAYAIHALYMVGFALVMHNRGLRASLDELIFPPDRDADGALPPLRAAAGLLDGIVLFCVTLALAGAMASCALALAAESARFGPWGPDSAALLALCGGLAVLALLAGARPATQLYKRLARWTFILMLALAASVIVLGPTGAILGGGLRSLGQYLWTFFSMSLFTGYASLDPWPAQWTIAHWGGWMITAPVLGVFLAQASRGYQVRDAVLLFAVWPALFAIVWIATLGGLAIAIEQQTGGALSQAMRRNGADDAALFALWRLPGAEALVIGFIALVGLSFVTFAAATLHATMRIVAPGPDDDRGVRAARRQAVLIWTGAMALAGWGLARSGAGPLAELLARIGEPLALLLALVVALALFRAMLSPGRAGAQD